MSKSFIFQSLRFFSVLIGIVGLYLTTKYTIVYFYPIIIAILLSLSINPFVTTLENKLKLTRSLATFITICTLFFLIVGVFVIVITELIDGTTYLAEQVPDHFQTFIKFAEGFINNFILPYYHKIITFIQTLNTSQQDTINDNIDQITQYISSTGGQALQNLFLKFPAVLSVLPHSLTVFMFIVIATFIITNDLHSIRNSITQLIPNTVAIYSEQIYIYIKKSIIGFFKAQLILITVTASMICVGLFILRIEHALTISVLAAAIDLLPYIGTGIIFIPWIIYLFITTNYSMTISLSILYMLIIITRQILEPKILSAHIGLNPLIILITLFIGIQIWGVVGLIIAPILLVLFNAIYQVGIIHKIWHFIKGS